MSGWMGAVNGPEGAMSGPGSSMSGWMGGIVSDRIVRDGASNRDVIPTEREGPVRVGGAIPFATPPHRSLATLGMTCVTAARFGFVEDRRPRLSPPSLRMHGTGEGACPPQKPRLPLERLRAVSSPLQRRSSPFATLGMTFVQATVAAAALFALACGGRTSPPPTAAPRAAAPSVAEAPAPVTAATLDEARSLKRNGRFDEYERSLRLFAAAGDPQLAHRALALLGLHQFEQKRLDEAYATLTRAAEVYPEVAPFLRLRLIEIEEERGNFANAAQLASRIIALNGDTSAAPSAGTSAATIARLRLPAEYARQGDVASTDAAYRAAIALPIDELSEEYFVALAKKLAAANRQDLSTAIRMRLLTEYPNGRFTEDTYDRLVALTASPLDNLSAAESIDLAARLGRNDRYDQALALLERTARRFPDAAAMPAYRNVRLRALFSSRHYTELLNETANAKLTDPANVLLRARAAWRSARPQEFLAGLNQLERDFPGSKEATEVRILRAKYYVTDVVDYPASLANLQMAIDAGATGNEGENLWNLGWTYTLAGRTDEALQTFEQYTRAFPDGDYKSNSLFWAGKLYERLGRRTERDAKFRQLIAEYPFSYFSYRARELMGVPVIPSSVVENGNVFPDVEHELNKVTDPRLNAVRELLAIDLGRDATREMKALAAAYPENPGVQFLLADVYVQGGEPFKANGVLQRRFRNFVRHGGTNVPPRFWQILFPLNYWESYRAEAEKRGLDPYLLVSITRQESGFEPTTVSNAGAVGLMQIMPAEAQSIAARANIEGVTRESLFDPETNIAVGAAEYAQKLETMNGNPTLAIAAYNAGEQAVGNWLAHTPADDMDLFIESIPYAETRLYVKSVTRNRYEYRRIYEPSSGQQQSQQQQTATR
jgi:soluble lytic murein transglycosylase